MNDSWFWQRKLHPYILAAFVLLMTGIPRLSLGACTSPAAGAGAREFFAADNTFRLCDGTNWISFFTDGTLGTCTKAGEFDYDATEKAYKYCNGTSWIASRQPVCTLSTGSITYQSKVTSATYLDQVVDLKLSPDGTKAYVVGQWNRHLSVYDTSASPSAPTLLGSTASITRLDDAQGVEIYGNYAYVPARSNDNLVVIDISDPAAPAYASFAQSSPADEMANIWGVGLSDDGQYAYTVSWDSGSGANKCYFHTVNISTPTSPSVVGSLNITDALVAAGHSGWRYCSKVGIKGSVAYVIHNDGGVVTIDVSTPTSPSLMGRVSNTNASQLEGHAFSSDGKYLLGVTRQHSKFNVFDISTPSSPTHVSFIQDTNLFDGMYNLKVVGKYAITTAYTSDAVAAVDISTPSSPTIVSSLKSTTHLDGANSIAIYGRYAYVAAYTGDSLVVLDLGCDPSTPSLGSCTQPGQINYLSTEKSLVWCDGSQWQLIAR